MNSKQRMRLAMGMKKADRVPVMCQLSLGHYFLHSGFDPVHIWFDSHTFAQALVDRQKAYSFDGILVNLCGRPNNWQEYIESRNGNEIIWKSGHKTVVPADDNAQSYNKDSTSLERASFGQFDPNNPKDYRHSGYVWNIYHIPQLWGVENDADLADVSSYPEWFGSSLTSTLNLAGDVSVHMEVFSPFTHFLELFGYENALFALIENPQKCESILQKVTEHVKTEVRFFAKYNPDAILISSAFAGAGFISREMYKQFVIPYEYSINSLIHEIGLPSYVHTCGAIGDRLDLMAETGIDGIDTLDPPPLGTVDLAKAKSEFGARLFFKGNLDGVNELLNADDKQFEDAVKSRLKHGMPNGGYILSTACSVPPYVKPERLKKLAVLANLYGQY